MCKSDKKREVKRWNVYHNLWAGYDAYFIVERTDPMYASGYLLSNAKRNWEIRRARFYRQDLEYDHLHFPIVGKINVHELMTKCLVDLIIGDGAKNIEQVIKERDKKVKSNVQ